MHYFSISKSRVQTCVFFKSPIMCTPGEEPLHEKRWKEQSNESFYSGSLSKSNEVKNEPELLSDVKNEHTLMKFKINQERGAVRRFSAPA